MEEGGKGFVEEEGIWIGAVGRLGLSGSTSPTTAVMTGAAAVDLGRFPVGAASYSHNFKVKVLRSVHRSNCVNDSINFYSILIVIKHWKHSHIVSWLYWNSFYHRDIQSNTAIQSNMGVQSSID